MDHQGPDAEVIKKKNINGMDKKGEDVAVIDENEIAVVPLIKGQGAWKSVLMFNVLSSSGN